MNSEESGEEIKKLTENEIRSLAKGIPKPMKKTKDYSPGESEESEEPKEIGGPDKPKPKSIEERLASLESETGRLREALLVSTTEANRYQKMAIQSQKRLDEIRSVLGVGEPDRSTDQVHHHSDLPLDAIPSHINQPAPRSSGDSSGINPTSLLGASSGTGGDQSNITGLIVSELIKGIMTEESAPQPSDGMNPFAQALLLATELTKIYQAGSQSTIQLIGLLGNTPLFRGMGGNLND